MEVTQLKIFEETEAFDKSKVSVEELIKILNLLLTSKLDENIKERELVKKYFGIAKLPSKYDKRNNLIEKCQKEIIKRYASEISERFNELNVNLEWDYKGWDTKKKQNRWYINSDGEIVLSGKEENGKEKNPWHDGRILDAILDVTIKGQTYTLFFILKGIESSGGSQSGVKIEIGHYYDLIQKNTDKNYHFFFVLDGTFLNEDVDKLGEKCTNYSVAASSTIKTKLENFIIEKLNSNE